MACRRSGFGLMLAGLIVTLVGFAVALTATFGIPRHWTTAAAGAPLPLAGAVRAPFGARRPGGGAPRYDRPLAVAGTVLGCTVIPLRGFRPREPFWSCFGHDLSICVLITLTLGISMGLYDAQRRRLDAVTAALRERELEHERARKMALEARLASLEARLQPHFMFNTLNAISALIQENPEEAERTIERLAALLRFALDATERGLVPLDHELKIVTDYVEIERTRFGERLTYAIDVDPEAAGCAVPPLAIQTLVSKGIKHPTTPRLGGGRLRVEATVRGDHVRLSVWDDGPGFRPDAMRAGHGLDNLRGRLAARFGADASLEIGRRDGGTLVTVALPRAGLS